MAKIDEFTERRIKDAADIVAVVSDFQTLKKKGRRYLGLCPFHDDRNLGSFIVGGSHNTCHCYVCNKDWDAIAYLMEKEGMKYPDALRWLGAKFGIYIDEANPVKIVKKAEPLKPETEKTLITMPLSFVKSKLNQDGNVLIGWLRSLDWNKEHLDYLNMVLKMYLVGTMTTDAEKGWPVFWYVTPDHKVMDGKMMKYKPDGHRDKTKVERNGKMRECYNFNWISYKLSQIGKFNPDTQRTEICLFGLHLLPFVDDNPDLEVCIVESEKSAIIMQTLSRPDQKLWMATAGKSGLDKGMLQPLLDKGCKITVFPDMDGYEDWKADAKAIDPRIQVQRLQDWGWQEVDGQKADIADVMLRLYKLIPDPTETESQKAHRKLGLKEENKALTELIEKLGLTVIR